MALSGEASAAVASVAPFLTTIIGNLGNVRQTRTTPSWHDLHGHAENPSRELELLGGSTAAPAPESEVEDAECECCGMLEECTPAYISGVRRRFSGRWVCGLCAEAVAEEGKRRGGGHDGLEAALAAHMAVCRRFNGFGRTHPALFQADAMKGILRKLSGPRSPKSNRAKPREATSKAAPPAA
ncbi:uncharacterized protein LOC104583977 [Brachypodium distachyon]|uniref:DUF1677 family protein n=1 Tax=Brachypodium distachyon TaxID=15368 RepID=I1HYZ8_BRADI|nr:uncharacterized protein LOC104583977 [Brachypodium distachyon]PNT66218.1 hypothetical protein BRADI_3g08750v3 [Brachypodium distachyon]|eukprot:XP_010236340.1 uncharacterized protein LOC104583977 [Brachypodium distachyon]